MRFERHQPVEGCEGNRQAIREQPARAEHLHFAGNRRVAGVVLFARPFVE